MELMVADKMETQKKSGPPVSSPVVQTLSRVCMGLLPLLSILWGLQISGYLGIPLFKEQFLSVMLGLALCAIFLMHRASKIKGGRVPWHDAFFSVLSLGTLFYVAYDYRRFQIEFPYHTMEMLIIGIIIVVMVLEGLRRTTGKVLFIIVLCFIAYGLVGHLVPQPLTGRQVELRQLLIYLGLDSNAALGMPLNVATSIVILYIIFGEMIIQTGGSAFFMDLSMALLGQRRGGPAKLAVISSALFGTISGSAVSNVATTGIITIPLMKKTGYPDYQAGAIETVASTGGQLMPPVMGAAAFLMAQFLEISYAAVCVAAVIPAILYYFAAFVQVDLMAGKYQIISAEKEFPNLRNVLREGWHFAVPFVVLILTLFIMNVEAETSAIYAAAAIAIIGRFRSYKGKRIDLKGFISSFWQAGRTMLSLFVIVAAAGFVIGILNITAGSFVLTLFLIQMGGGSLFLLLLIAAVVSIILGMGMPTTGVYVLLAALVVPALVQSGVFPISAHLFIFYYGMMSMITPPVALAAYAAATISGADAMRIGYEAMRLGWVAFIIPFAFVISPTLILQGDLLGILIDCSTAFIGVYVVSVGMVGYFMKPLSPIMRMIILIAGFAAILPHAALTYGGYMNLVGVLLSCLVLVREYVVTVRLRAAMIH